MDGEQRQHFEKLLQRYQQRLRVLEIRAATLGLNTPAEVEIEVQELGKKIADIEAKLADGLNTPAEVEIEVQELGKTIADSDPIIRNRRWYGLIFSIFGAFLLVLAFWLGNRLPPFKSGVQQNPPYVPFFVEPSGVESRMLNPAFEWRKGVSEDSTYILYSNPNELTLRAGSNTRHSIYDTSSPMLLYSLDGDFEASVKVVFNPTMNYQFAGMGVLSTQDSNTWLHADRGFFDQQLVNTFFVHSGRISTSKDDRDYNNYPYLSETIYLKIVKQNNIFTTSYSSDGISWKNLLSKNLDTKGEFKIFLYVSSETNTIISANFYNFTIIKR